MFIVIEFRTRCDGDNVSNNWLCILFQTLANKRLGSGCICQKYFHPTRKQDHEFDYEGVETCFIEINRTKQKRLLIRWMCMHPSGCFDKLPELCKKLDHINWQGLEAYLTGDVDLNVFTIFLIDNPRDTLTCSFLWVICHFNITKVARITDHSETLTIFMHTNARF